MQKRKFNLYVLYVFLTYLVLMGYFCILRGGGILWVTITQVVLALFMLANFYVVANVKGWGRYVFVFLSTLLSCWILNGAYVENGLNMFGPTPADSLEYIRLGRITSTMPLDQALRLIYNYDKIDDMGMPIIARLCYTIGGSDDGYYVVLQFLNALAVTLSTIMSYKASRLLADRDTASVVSAIFASTGHFVMFATYGLKENFFLLIIILTIYFVLKMSNKGVFTGLVGFLVFAPWICFFRLAVIAQIIIAIGVALMLKYKKYRWLSMSFVAIVAGYVFLNYIDNIIMSLGGGNLDSWITYAEAHNTGTSATFQYFTQFVFSFMGNPPMFNIVDELDFVHFVSFSACVRCFLCPFFILGMIDLAKKFDSSKVFLIVYWLVGTFMLIVVLRGSDFRYSSMYFLPFLIITMIGFDKRKEFWFSKYLCAFIYFVTLLVTWGWNF